MLVLVSECWPRVSHRRLTVARSRITLPPSLLSGMGRRAQRHWLSGLWCDLAGERAGFGPASSEARDPRAFFFFLTVFQLG
jgi:hypothetical protein